MTRRRRAALAAASGLVGVLVAGCGVIPHRVESDPAHRAVTLAQAVRVVDAYNAGRASALADRDLVPLQQVAAGAALAVDTVQSQPQEFAAPTQLIAGNFRRYPMWFVAVCDVPGENTVAAAVFARSTSRGPWLLVDAPRLAPQTKLPAVKLVDGAAVAVGAGSAIGSAGNADEIAAQYADVLGDPASRYAGDFEKDSFIAQMRRYADAQPPGVGFEQSWRAAGVSYALRLADGGALIFADFVRTERYDVGGKALRFDGTEAERFLPDPIRERARLTYYHQVLLFVPGDGKALAIGQYGALVRGTGV